MDQAIHSSGMPRILCGPPGEEMESLSGETEEKSEVGWGVAMIWYKAAKERMSDAMGPFTAQVLAWFAVGADDTRPCVVFRP